MTVLEEDENEELGRILRRLLGEDVGGNGYVSAGKLVGLGRPDLARLTVDASVSISLEELELVERVIGSSG